MGLISIHLPWLHIWFSMHSVIFGFFGRRSSSARSDAALGLTLSLESGKGMEEDLMKVIRATMVIKNNILDIFVMYLYQAVVND